MEQETLLEVKSISKAFPGVQALADVSFDIRRGEVHALVGENGAGKSTLINILSGIHQPDSGEILYLGEEIKLNKASDAWHYGIATIHQELAAVTAL